MIHPHFCEDAQYMVNPIPARLVVLVALFGLAATAAAAPAPLECGPLCGRWTLDVAASDPVEARLDAALAAYRESLEPRPVGDDPKNLRAAAEVELRESLGPIKKRPDRDELREQLLAVLKPPETLQVTLAGPDVLIGADDRYVRRYSPGVPHSRVDAFGTAKITAAITPGRFTINERYDRQREYLETYAVQRADGSLLVERQVTRPGMTPLRLRAVYRPG
jgi:hypothetical protein